MAALNVRTAREVTATWDPVRLAWRVQMPDGRVLLALDEDGARRTAAAYVGTWQPVRFVGPIVFPKAGS